MRAPCKECPDRKIGCHSECARYITYRAEKDEERAKRMELHRVNEAVKDGMERCCKPWKRKTRRKYT